MGKSQRRANVVSTLSRWQVRLNRFIRRLARLEASSHSIALGGALGIFIAFTPTFGIQVLLVLLFGAWLRVSLVPALVLVFVTNVFTIGPIYWFNYKVGVFLCRMESIGRQRFMNILGLGGLNWWERIKESFFVAGRIALPLWVGSLVVALLLAIPTYSIMLRLVEGHRLVHEEKLRKRRLRRLQRQAAGSAPESDPRREGPADESPQSPMPNDASTGSMDGEPVVP